MLINYSWVSRNICALRSLRFVLLFASLLFSTLSAQAWQATGTFIDRKQSDDLRIFSYNMYWDSLFDRYYHYPDGFIATSTPELERLHQAVNADIYAFQEVRRSASEIADIFNEIAPLQDERRWVATSSRNQVIVSSYEFIFEDQGVNDSRRGIATALIDLPDQQFEHDLYLLNNHYPCCGGDDSEYSRLWETDAILAHLHDARNSGGDFTLAENTHMVVLGDLNIVRRQDPLINLIRGNILHETQFGPDSPPDWDGSWLADAHPFHNDLLVDDYTWRNDRDIYEPGRLDYILYSDSTLELAKTFVLNTGTMTERQLIDSGLEQGDIALSIEWGTYDHLPLIADFNEAEIKFIPMPSASLLMIGLFSFLIVQRRVSP